MLFVPFFRKKAYTVSRCSFVHKWDRQFFLRFIAEARKLHNHGSFVQYFHSTEGAPEGVLRYGWIGISFLGKKKAVVHALLLPFGPFLELLDVLL